MRIFRIIWQQSYKNKIFRIADELTETSLNAFFVKLIISDEMAGFRLNIRSPGTLEIMFRRKIFIDNLMLLEGFDRQKGNIFQAMNFGWINI